MNHGRIKNQKNTTSVEAFINSIENQKRKEDSFVVLGLMKKITKVKPDMWGHPLLALEAIIINMPAEGKMTGF